MAWGGEPAVPKRRWAPPALNVLRTPHLRRGCWPERGGHGGSRRGPEHFPPLTFVGGWQGVGRPAGSAQAALLGPPGVHPGGGGSLSGLEAGRHFPDSWLLSVVCPGPPAPTTPSTTLRGFHGSLGSGVGTPLGGPAWRVLQGGASWGSSWRPPVTGPPMTDTRAWGLVCTKR